MGKLPIVVLGSLTLAACAGKPPLGGAPGLDVVSSDAIPTPTRADFLPSGKPFIISPMDKLTINVFGIEELKDREVVVDTSGRVSFPLVGALQVAGKSPDEVAEEVRLGLRRSYVRDPQVSVNVSEISGQLVAVEGAVMAPGLYPVLNNMSLIRSVASAKGTTDLSDLEDVVIFRTVDGRRYAALYNLGAIRRGVYDDPEIFANDVVIVGESPARRLFRDFLAITPVLTAPLVVALQNGN